MDIFTWIGPRDLRQAEQWAARHHAWAAELCQSDTGRPFLHVRERDDARLPVGVVMREAAGFVALDAAGRKLAEGKLLPVLEALARAHDDGSIRALVAAESEMAAAARRGADRASATR